CSSDLDAGVGLCRLPGNHGRLSGGGGRAVPFLQLWRRHVYYPQSRATRARGTAMTRTCRMSFELLATEGKARRGRLTFPRGVVETPAFMPVGTYGTVKGMLPRDIEAIGAQIILGNTFHLWLRPGTEVIKKHGDLHDFMQWQGPILTDSGGFQVFSLGAMRKIKEEGVYFASPVDGAKVFMGPEESMQVQRDLGSDIVMIFDECTPYPAEFDVA